ncbi:PAS domain-containing protein [Tundrisphaera lichenicola]|uniref:PAS domain-containing protein n=1 Tax=Tundrisphaera lichenicola TaxID=2029860 RepID=UPI003EB9324B
MNSVEPTRWDEQRLARARRASTWAGTFCVGLGALVLVGLALDIPTLRGVLNGWATMKANTALAFVAAGASLCLVGGPARLTTASLVLAAVVASIGLLTLGEYLAGVDLGLDEWLIRVDPAGIQELHPGRMSPVSALNFAVVGLALLLLNARIGRWRALGQWATLIPAMTSLLALVGYAYGVQGMYQFQQFSSIAVHTALGFVVLCGGLLLVRPTGGPMAVVLDDSLGGVMARRLLPTLLILYFFIGWLRLMGSRRGLFGETFGISLQVVTSTVVTTGLVWWNARSLNFFDRGQRRMLDRLRQGEARSRQIAEGLPQLVWTCRSDGYCDYLGRQWVEYTGVPEEDQLGFRWSDAVHPGDLPGLMEHWGECIKSGGFLDVEFRIRSASGEYRWFKTRGLPLRDDSGAIVKWFGTNTDIHDERLQAEALRESEERLRRVLKAARLGHWEWDLADDWMTYQGGATSVYGRPDRISFVSIIEFLEASHPDDRPGLKAALERSIADDAPFETEFRIVHLDGSVRWLASKGGVSRDPEGRAIRMAGVNIDITEKKEAEAQIRRLNEDLERRVAERTADLALANALLREGEERFRGAFDAAAIGVALVAPDGRWLQVNDSVCQIVGYSEADLLGRSFQEITHPDDLETDLDQVRRVLAGEIRSFQMEKRYFHRDGHVVWVLLSVSLVRDAEGSPLHFVSQIQDITERKRFEAELLAARDQAMAATRAKAEFLANMSHEIRTPMNGVIGMTELLLDTQLDDLQRDYSETIRSSGEALLTVINDILDFSKIEAGKLSLEATGFGLRTLMEEVSDLLAPRAHQKGLELICRVDPEVPDRLVGDPGRIRQILTNLAGNAVKFTDKGEVVLEARLIGKDEGRATFKVFVHDTGVGIPEDRQAEVFESFTQVDGGSNRRFGGTGLGLTICRSLVGMMGGTIGLESRPGRGSTFWFELRLGFEADEGDQPRPDIADFRVLVVDDHETNRTVAREILLSWGCRSDEVCSGAEALLKLMRSPEDDPYRLVLLDHDMPGMDGDRTARAIRASSRHSRTPLVLMSSLGQSRVGDEPEAGLFSAVLTKPLRRSQLYNALCRATDGNPDSSRRPGSPTVAGELKLPRPLFVLLAEDNDVNRRVATGMVERLGGRIEAVRNGREAVEAHDHGRHDLILMDVQMPEMDGLAATRAIREAEKATGVRIPIVALTAHAMQGDRERCLIAGMDDYLTKPLRPAPLLEALIAWGIGGKAPRDRDVVEPPTDLRSFRLESLRESCGNDPEIIRDVLGLILEETPERLDRLDAAIATGDRPRIVWEAHSLKGGFLTIGAEALASACQELLALGEAADSRAIEEASRPIRGHWEQLKGEATRFTESLAMA